MSFICPQCSAKTLTITSRIELESDIRSDEVRLQIVECSTCDFNGVAVYEESRRGALDSDSYDHYGYKLSAASVQSLKHLINACPDTNNTSCSCLTHRTLNRADKNGRWNALDNFEKQGYFSMTSA